MCVHGAQNERLKWIVLHANKLLICPSATEHLPCLAHLTTHDDNGAELVDEDTVSSNITKLCADLLKLVHQPHLQPVRGSLVDGCPVMCTQAS